MLTANQQCVLCPQLVKDQCNTLLKKRSPKKCLFESDPKETRRLLEELLEEQFLADRELMLRKYNFDILTSTFVTNVRSAPEREKETGSKLQDFRYYRQQQMTQRNKVVSFRSLRFDIDQEKTVPTGGRRELQISFEQ
ncbi:hypothetical protein L798_00719 [Zootermopsis nevadensis]|uniref:Uncharacterized protein n=1 Tax=Zootermopsis nevadensis TaxID=136037 RepID=A0A067RQA9_ZOONE|nr:hypothetical protein L798_00719 [Zootermopsis nevadensis]